MGRERSKKRSEGRVSERKDVEYSALVVWDRPRPPPPDDRFLPRDATLNAVVSLLEVCLPVCYIRRWLHLTVGLYTVNAYQGQ